MSSRSLRNGGSSSERESSDTGPNHETTKFYATQSYIPPLERSSIKRKTSTPVCGDVTNFLSDDSRNGIKKKRKLVSSKAKSKSVPKENEKPHTRRKLVKPEKEIHVDPAAFLSKTSDNYTGERKFFKTRSPNSLLEKLGINLTREKIVPVDAKGLKLSKFMPNISKPQNKGLLKSAGGQENPIFQNLCDKSVKTTYSGSKWVASSFPSSDEHADNGTSESQEFSSSSQSATPSSSSHYTNGASASEADIESLTSGSGDSTQAKNDGSVAEELQNSSSINGHSTQAKNDSCVAGVMVEELQTSGGEDDQGKNGGCVIGVTPEELQTSGSGDGDSNITLGQESGDRTKEKGDVLYSVFKPISAKSNGKEQKSHAVPKSKKLKPAVHDEDNQLMIDAGQKEIGAKVCPTCCMVYHLGNVADENLHIKFHETYLSSLQFQGWKRERVIGDFIDGRVIMVTKEDPRFMLKKVQEILNIVNRELGTDNSMPTRPDPAFLLFCSIERKITGVLVAESISYAYSVELDKDIGGLVLPKEKDGNYKKVNALCGVNRLWVAKEHRRQGIAKRLMNCLRCNYIYGYPIPIKQIAFLDPSNDGIKFFAGYSLKQAILVYK